MNSNLNAIMDKAKFELIQSGGLERERALRHMHVYFVRGLWRWFTSTPEADDEWKAHAHMKLALVMLEVANAS